LIIRIEVGDKKWEATLLETIAPKTCKAILDVLPIRGRAIHARWSGEAMWIQAEDLQVKNVGYENATAHPSKGELLFYFGPISERELLIPYGPCSFASKAGSLAGNHFATIDRGRDELAEMGKKVLWQGAQNITISTQ
jgi:hypothetical protein